MFTSNPDPAAQQRELQSVYQWFSVNKPLMTTVSTQDAFALASLLDSHAERDWEEGYLHTIVWCCMTL